jgi:Protein of unknown function (Hypoth_ymh)
LTTINDEEGIQITLPQVINVPAPKSTRRQHPALPIQYLGRSGTTYPCVEAMVTILTSPYRCREITVVFQEQQPGEDSHAVCFVVWDWLDCEITIVPDGFGTHAGTGGWGLAVVLSLIQFYQIPLKEKWVEARQFERIASGHLTARDREQLHQADHCSPSWPSHVGDFGSHLWAQAGYETAQFPYWLIEPELLGDVKDVERNPGSAVFQAARRLEMLVRALGPYPAELVGQGLINQAMGEGRPFEPKGATASGRQAWAHLFRGAMGAIRNPEGHRDQQLKLEDAIGQILTVNMLLRKLKQDFPNTFQKEEPTNREGEEDE